MLSPEDELFSFENYSHFSSTLSPKIIGHVLKNKQKNKCVCIHEIIRLIVIKMKMKMKNRSHRFDINRPGPRHGQKYNKYQVPQYLSISIYNNDAYMY